MIITCPSCSANYRLKPEVINPSTGRVVRCSSCGNIWRVYAPQKAVSQHHNVNNNLESHIRKPKKYRIFYWILSIILLNIIFFGFIFLFKREIIKSFPQTERFYQIFGVEANVTGISLVMPYLEKINHSDGRVSLLIQGSFLNSHPKKTLKIQPLKITLLDNANIPIATYIKNKFNPELLLAGGPSDFTFEIKKIPKGAVDVRIEFDTTKPKK